MNLSTKMVEKKFNITRQTLHNWINEGLLTAPKKDFRNWYVWSDKDLLNIQNIIDNKIFENNNQRIDNSILKIENRRYLGSKQKMLNFIDQVVENNVSNVDVVADIFGGTGVVSDLFRKKGKKIIINDILHSNFVNYNTWFGNETIDYTKVISIIDELNNLTPTSDNYVSINFGNKYFSYENAKKIGAIRERIDSYDINSREKSFLLTSLLYAMDKVANTVGHYDAYRKTLDTLTPIHLKVPEYNTNNNNEIFCEDSNQLVKKIQADLVYIDTPYNSRQYGDAYHLLENIIDWKKPELTGIALKMPDRQHIKSKYSTSKAPEAFNDLIANINAKYILVSYNNMAKKGSGRSNAKISNAEIISILEKKGNVRVFETPFKVFTTGKTNIKNHKEILYLCETKDYVSSKKQSNVIKSAINYTGGKFKLIPQLLPLFPKNINTFYDVFAGGANVTVNVNAKKYYANDINSKIIDLFKKLNTSNYSDTVEMIEKIIEKYKLSNTKYYGYEYYNANSSIGLKEVNKKSYLKLRKSYNNHNFDKSVEPLILYILIVYGFNNQIRFNNSGEFNMPTGKRDFNKQMKKKLESFMHALHSRNIEYSSLDFKEFLKNQNFEENDFVYLDPPYILSTASYNENNGWNEKDELNLFTCLDELHEKGVKFALSNVLVHKGKENKSLLEWSKKYNVHELRFNYNNSNYQSKAKANITTEVLITNY
ncbi:Dam family site-specific DNA-(adenine-N6)-methyltransferase [Streptococcus uberis]|uniref:Dam family site-specific DNA-(adenine-N6)-methyltransferase n=1 Tax=Streptococcus uberis TaxID=1349 RepID=UPI0012B641F9|nr:Dam family site-specific DNA-(adenine-N6)-methyltransferase [Streptococcus uberis]MTB63129.1 Dam family site-specific DNA-(adenine-N6)-methyltransferase [Streptococcus uberis]MTB92464.1 Dam family site-specific DNA-(adenine-N6)-methyltransferase [Streptococcus uberis]